MVTFSSNPISWLGFLALAAGASLLNGIVRLMLLVFLLIGILALGVAAKGVGKDASLIVTDLVRDAAQLDPLWVKTGFVLALVGISAKIGLAPMHPGFDLSYAGHDL